MEEEKVNSLIFKKFADEITQEEEIELQTWLSDSKTNQDIYQQMQKLWDSTSRSQETDLPDIDEEWSKLEKRLQLNQTEKTSSILKFERKTSKKEINFAQNRWIAYYAIAAVLVLFIGVTFFIGDNQIIESTQFAETKSVILPDGSEVKLNNDSKIIYGKEFSEKDRIVTLRGEAFFSVVKNQNPFFVETENASLQVLGTEFNVWARNEETRIIVSEGKVSLRSAGSEEDEGLVLTANQMAVKQQGQTPVLLASSIDAAARIGWLENRIVFDETNLKEVVEELMRTYDVKIELSNSKLMELSISGSFEKKPIDQILEAICLTLDLQFNSEGGKYVLEGI